VSTYSWPGPFTPFEHQKATTKFLLLNDRCFCLNDMGTGKTSSALWAADFLMQYGFIRKVLVVGPLSTIDRVWADEAFKVLMHRQTVVLHGAAEKRRKLYNSSWDIAIINYDGVNVLYDELMNDDELDLIIVDEASFYRNGQTARYKNFKKLTDKVSRLWMLTGTPCPQEPTDAYALAKLVDDTKVPRFFGTFRMNTMYKVSQFKWVPRRDGYDKAFEVLKPAIRYKKEDCGLDLPPMTVQSWEVNMSPKQKRAYTQMQKEMKLAFSSGDPLTAVNAADKINKLRQIACGVTRDTNTGEYLVIDYKPRLEATLDAIRNAGAKVIVVVPFKGMVYDLASQINPHYSTAVINGDVPRKMRNEIITQFRSTPDPHVLLVHPKVMAHGLTLTEADTMVFYAPIYSNEEARQIVERINRPGQKRSMTVVRLGATALEWEIYGSLDKRAEGEDYLLDLYKRAFAEKA